METSSIAAMVHAMMATLGDLKTPEGIRDALAYWMTVLDPSSAEGWSAVFERLGPSNQGVFRFRIIEGVLSVLRDDPYAADWLEVWMSTIDASQIHPVSLPLCSFRILDSFKSRVFAAYADFSSSRPLMPRIVGGYCSPHEVDIDPAEIQLAPGGFNSNLVCSFPLEVCEQNPGDCLQAGYGWCVWDVVFKLKGLVSIGPDLIVLRNLDLINAPAINRIGPNCRVGGITKMRSDNVSGWATTRSNNSIGPWETSVGVRTAGGDMAWNRYKYIDFRRECLPNPIETCGSVWWLVLGFF